MAAEDKDITRQKLTDKDINALIRRWQTKRDQKALDILMNHYQPLLYKAINKYTIKDVPPDIVELEVYKNFVKAVDSFKPKKKVKFITFLYPYLEKSQRLSGELFSGITIPEHRRYLITEFEATRDLLRNKLNREPTVSEIADKMKLPTKEVARLIKEVETKEVKMEPFQSELVPEVFFDDRIEYALNMIYMDLKPEERLVMEYMFGMHGKPKLKSITEISQKLKMPYSTVQSIVAKIKKELGSILGS